MDEYSVRTQYRKIRVKYIRSTIALLIDMLEMPKQRLEKIPLSFFKKIKNEIAGELFLEKDSEREMSGTYISPNNLDYTTETEQKNHFTKKLKNE